MLNIYELESRWLKYKLKKLLPFSIIFFSLVIILIITFFFYQNKEKTKQQLSAFDKKEHIVPIVKKEENNSSVQKKTEETNDTIPKKTEIIIKQTPQVPKTKAVHTTNNISLANKEKNERLKLTPSMNFIRSMRDDTLPYYEHEAIPEQSLDTQSTLNTHPIEQSKKPQTGYTSDSKVENTKSDIKITIKTSHKDIEDVIRRFKKNNNPALSLFIAKKYYELGDYDKSYNYALMTNEINRDIEASWIIFSKSLVKLNKKDMAIKTLKQYIKQSGSDKARRLLNDILIGKFK